jgi:hypothetical protein
MLPPKQRAEGGVSVRDETNTETLRLALALQPLVVFVPVTLYVELLAGLTTREEEVEPLLHKYELAPLALNVTEFPAQSAVFDAMPETFGTVKTTTP